MRKVALLLLPASLLARCASHDPIVARDLDTARLPPTKLITGLQDTGTLHPLVASRRAEFEWMLALMFGVQAAICSFWANGDRPRTTD